MSTNDTTLKTWFSDHGRELSGLIGLILLCLIFSIWSLLLLDSQRFLTGSNLLNIGQQTAIIAIIAVGMTYVIITAGIDLSVGSIIALSGVVLAMALKSGMAMPLALFCGLAMGGLCGFVNGGLIAWGKLPPFIATLGMMSMARGLTLILSDGRSISSFSSSFRAFATGSVFIFPMPLVIMFVVYLLAQFGLKRTALGRYAFAIGGNEEAAKLSGINVTAYKIAVYVLCGTLSGLAAIILTARLNAAQPTAGTMYELDAIAATVIGGTSLMGGEGSVIGTLIGALIMGVLKNGLTIMNVSSFIQQVVIGGAIITAVLIDMAIKKRRA